jgi:flagellar protein FliS
MKKSALDQYKKVGNESDAASASPHRLIQMLFNGALEKISVAKGSMERGEIAKKGQNIGWAISIIEGLRTSLDKDAGGEIAANLDSLYNYMEERLFFANAENNVEILDEVTKLLKTVKTAWDEVDGISTEVGQATQASESIFNLTVR